MATAGRIPWRYDHWKYNAGSLRPQDGHILVSIYEDETGVGFTREAIRDEDIPEMCERTSSLLSGRRWSFELLVTCNPNGVIANHHVPYSLAAIEAFRVCWEIPHNYVPRHAVADTANMSFSPKIGEETWRGLTIDLVYCVSVVTHDTENHRTFGICAFKNAEDGRGLLLRIERLPSFAQNPLFALQAVADITVHHLRLISGENVTSCVDMESKLGYWSSQSEMGLVQPRDFAWMTQSLNQLAIHAANQEHNCSKMASALDCLRDQLQLWPTQLCPEINVELQEQVRYLQQCTACCLALYKRIRDGVQSMTQTVYATLQQRDNQLNHRYGADMRLITAITLMFLPGTFVATFFSTTFWNFSPDNRGAKVTYWVYLYFVVTVGLTLLVIVVWRKFSTLKRLTVKTTQIGGRVPLLGRLMKEKKMDDEESGKKGD